MSHETRITRCRYRLLALEVKRRAAIDYLRTASKRGYLCDRPVPKCASPTP